MHVNCKYHMSIVINLSIYLPILTLLLAAFILRAYCRSIYYQQIGKMAYIILQVIIENNIVGEKL